MPTENRGQIGRANGDMEICTMRSCILRRAICNARTAPRGVRHDTRRGTLVVEMLPTRTLGAARDYAVAAGFVVLAGAVAKTLEGLVGLVDPGMIFLTAVLCAAATTSFAASLFASVSTFLVYNFFFVDPLHTFSVSDPGDIVSMSVFLIVAVLTSHLTARIREQAEFVAIERAKTQAVLEEKAKTEQVIEAIEDGLVVLDETGRVAHANEVACAILGLEKDVVLGNRFEDLAVSHSHYFRLREAVREFLAHPSPERERTEVRVFLRGRDHHYVLRPSSFRFGGASPAGLILVLQDVTYLRDQEGRRESLVAMLSHELGTPLTSLKMAIELMRQNGRIDARELVESANEDVLRLQDVAQRFLDLARSRATIIALDRKGLELGAVASRVLKLFALQAREKGVRLECSNEGRHEVTGDETKLTWALSNLVANAIRYTPAGGSVAIQVHSAGAEVVVNVSDTGIGIPPESQPRIFEPFTQSSDEPGSAGLGLAIVRDIVQAHGGRICLESKPHRGTRFTLQLPRG